MSKVNETKTLKTILVLVAIAALASTATLLTNNNYVQNKPAVTNEELVNKWVSVLYCK